MGDLAVARFQLWARTRTVETLSDNLSRKRLMDLHLNFTSLPKSPTPLRTLTHSPGASGGFTVQGMQFPPVVLYTGTPYMITAVLFRPSCRSWAGGLHPLRPLLPLPLNIPDWSLLCHYTRRQRRSHASAVRRSSWGAHPCRMVLRAHTVQYY